MSSEISVIELLSLIVERDLIVTVNGASMAPTIVRGDRVHLRHAKSGAPLELGQIVLCKDTQGKVLIHRVVRLSPGLETRGDALEQSDAPIVEVLGVVTRIERTWRSRLRRITLKLKGAFGGHLLEITRLDL